MWSSLPWMLVVTLGAARGGHIPGVALNDTLNLAFLGPTRILTGALPAFSVALKEVQRRQLLPGYDIQWQYRDSNCNPYSGNITYKVKMDFVISIGNCLLASNGKHSCAIHIQYVVAMHGKKMAYHQCIYWIFYDVCGVYVDINIEIVYVIF